jgi:hypothetical protein
MNQKRGSLYLITGLVIGAIGGLLFAWLITPVQYTNTSPAALRADFKDQYRAMIALAYTANGDLVRARARLALLRDADPSRILAAQAQQTLAKGGTLQEARSLGQLANALGQAPQGAPPTLASQVPSVTIPALPASPTLPPITGQITPLESTPIITTTVDLNSMTFALNTPLPTTTSLYQIQPITSGTPLPTLTATATPGAPFALEGREQLCASQPLIQVIALDAAGQPVPGVEIIIAWDNGEERFFTGLKPELGVGYADFSMSTGITYTLRLAEGGQSIADLATRPCKSADGVSAWQAWRLSFSQP